MSDGLCRDIYSTWKGMIARCNHPGNHKYPRYGGRGIRVCDRWSDYENFIADMGPRPDGTSLDRINNNGDYEPGNCRWATHKKQNRNRSDNRLLTYRGETKTLPDWADEYGINRTTLKVRLDRGWSTERALTQPVQERVMGEGWKLVPIKVTKEMCEAAAKKRDCVVSANLYATISAAIMAAPQPDHSPGAAMQVFQDVEGTIPAKPGDPVGLAISPDPFSDHSPDAGKVVQGDLTETAIKSSPAYRALYAEKQHLLNLLKEPAPDGGEPVAWAVFADNGNLRIWGREKPKSFPDAVPLYLGPAVKDSLTVESQVRLDSEDQKGMERIVEAVAHIGIDFGYGTYELEQCHIDRAREIKESLARLRASQQEGGDDSEKN